MFRQLDDFLAAYEQLSGSTTRLFARLTDESLAQAITDEHRTVGQIAWHIVVTVPEMMNRTGLGISGVDFESPPPSTSAELVEGYEKVTAELVDAVKTKWNDDTLLETDDMYGQQWQRGFTLTALIQHEIHHRGQLAVLLRQAGQQIPGLFGPSKEEWAQFGMEAPTY